MKLNSPTNYVNKKSPKISGLFINHMIFLQQTSFFKQRFD